ncbi:MAG TPA: 4Fe-4S binding protein [Nitrospirae bacterium]|nr:4Fe-4S binding protein [Nitrospirota bacterium]
MTEDKQGPFLRTFRGRPYLRVLRYLIQWSIVIIVIYGGISLYGFLKNLQAGKPPLIEKPLSVEGFMPIGAFMALKLWITESLFDPVHPAALVIFISAILTSLFFKKGFCGWICPVGTVSEFTYKAGRGIFGRNFSLPRYIDYPLRSIKYLLMAFFLYIILIKMSPESIRAFLLTPYWMVADLKLLIFFTDISITTLTVLMVLLFSSLLVKNFWCRYLCPYGALLGLLSILSPVKVTRDPSRCIHCHKCTRSCPALLPVEDRQRVYSPECTGCLTCISQCPAQGALDLALPGKRGINPVIYILLIITLFGGGIMIAKAAGYWKSNVTYEQYGKIVPHLKEIEHP